MSAATPLMPGRDARHCARCGTELAPDAVACPACHALIHAERLRALAARAEQLTAEGALEGARDEWQQSLTLLPVASRQHEVISARIEALEARLAAQTTDSKEAAKRSLAGQPWWRRWAGGLVAIALLLLGKFKFLLLGLGKLKTLLSMFAFFGVYWTMFGWPLALGFVVGIYIHEMGHVAMLRKLGIGASAPMFIPGVGAFILAKKHITDPRQDAAVGLAGPIWGLGAGLAAYAAYVMTDAKIWLAIASVTGTINLFNLLPVWQLDGSRGFHALDRVQRWGVVAAFGFAFWLTRFPLLAIIGAVAIWRAFQREQGPGDSNTFTTFLILIGALGWLSSLRAF